MSDDLTIEANASGVSPLRKAVSAVVLCVLVIVLVVELRAGMGHMMSGKMLQEESPEGAFHDLPLAEFEAMLSFAPARTVVRENDDEVEYKYSWYSLLRPLLRPEAAYYVVVATAAPKNVKRYNTEPPSEQDLAAVAAIDMPEDMEFSEDGGSGGPGGGFSPGGPSGGPGGGVSPGGPGGGPGGGFDPGAIFDRRDENRDGKLTGEELGGRLQDRVAQLDKNSDGELTREEFMEGMQNAGSRGQRGPRGGGENSGSARRVRPEIEDDTDVENEPAEEKAE